MQELPGVSGWEVCVHSSHSAGRKIIRKTRKREAEGFDNEALRIRGRCFASGLWVKSQGVSSPCLGGSIHHSEDSTTTCRWWHRQPQEMSTYLSKNIRINEMPFFLLFFLYFLRRPLLPVLHQQECCIILLVAVNHWQYFAVASKSDTVWSHLSRAMMQKSEIKHSWVCQRPQGGSDPSRSSFSQKVILVFCHYTFGV